MRVSSKGFKDILTDVNSNLALLPILHTCSAKDLINILDEGKLSPAPCDVFEGKDYLYLYYGIPAYRLNFYKATGNPAAFPVCFIIDYEKTPDLNRLFPFDTGAFSRVPDFKDKYMDRDMQVEHFELHPYITEAPKLIEKFYTSNSNYVMRKKTVREEDIDVTNAEALSYFSIIQDITNGVLDNRISTMELLFNTEIELNNESLIHIIAPDRFIENTKIQNALDKLGVTSKAGYSHVPGNPNEYFGLIYNYYLSFLREKTFI